jgi:hypothetical protein
MPKTRNQLLIGILIATALLSWLSTPRDVTRQIRVARGVDGMDQPVLSQTTCKICMPTISMLNVITSEISLTNGPAK